MKECFDHNFIWIDLIKWNDWKMKNNLPSFILLNFNDPQRKTILLWNLLESIWCSLWIYVYASLFIWINHWILTRDIEGNLSSFERELQFDDLCLPIIEMTLWGWESFLLFNRNEKKCLMKRIDLKWDWIKVWSNKKKELFIYLIREKEKKKTHR